MTSPPLDPAPVPSRFDPALPFAPADEGVALRETPGWIVVSGAGYSLALPSDRGAINRSPYAVLLAPDGHDWTDISLLSSVDRVDGTDESGELEAAVAQRRSDDEVLLRVGMHSSVWRRRELVLRCTPGSVALSVHVVGDGAIADLTVFGGAGVLASGAAGVFRSSIGFASVFVPVPTEPIAFTRPAESAAALGVVGDADPGRLNGIFSPPPLAFGLGRRAPGGGAQLPGGDWFGLSVRAEVADLRFTTLRYEPLDGGFLLRAHYEGHTEVRGSWTSPEFVLRPASSAWDVLDGHRADLVAHGLADDAPRQQADWWFEPMFCGWGAQCARATGRPRQDGEVVVAASALARESVYDEFLARLREHGLEPGTIVIDDRWQAEYGLGTPDTEHWPDLRRWIADRHAKGRRVLLWWKAWDPQGVPADECVTDASGRPVAVDPANPAYRDRLASIVSGLLGPDGLDADGLKIDFTQRTPSGRSLRSGGSWGIAMLHELLGTIYAAAKEAKPDALVVTHAVHPSFGDIGDMVRLNDVLRNAVDGTPVPAARQLVLRQGIAARTLPRHAIDTDQWPMPSRAEWLDYVRTQPRLGVPALYYVESIDGTGEAITDEDLAVVARSWQGYREAG